MLLFPMSFFCFGEFSFKWENVIFACYLRGCDMHIDFLRLLFLVGVICPLMQEHSLRLKKLISQVPQDAMLKIRRPVYKRLFKSNRVLSADQKSDVNQTCQQSVFSSMGACIRIWCAEGAVERPSQMHPFHSLSSRIFHPFPKQRACSQAKVYMNMASFTASCQICKLSQ